jgi:hypothetical protein
MKVNYFPPRSFPFPPLKHCLIGFRGSTKRIREIPSGGSNKSNFGFASALESFEQIQIKMQQSQTTDSSPLHQIVIC